MICYVLKIRYYLAIHKKCRILSLDKVLVFKIFKYNEVTKFESFDSNITVSLKFGKQ